MQVGDGGVSQPVNLRLVLVGGVDEPRKRRLIDFAGNFFRYDASDGDIGVFLAHLDEILLASVLVPYGDGLLARHPFELVPQPLDLRQPDDAVNIQLEKEFYVEAVDEVGILRYIGIPITAALVGTGHERISPAIEQE